MVIIIREFPGSISGWDVIFRNANFW